MELRVGFKQTEVGVIPEDWLVRKLGDLATVRDGTHQTPRYVPVGVPFYSVEHVTSGDFKNTKFISEAEHRFLTRTCKIETGDILMTRIGSIGDCKLIDWDVNASFYVSLALLKVNPNVSAAYISQYSNSASFKREIELHSLQSAIPKKINLGPISEIKIALPPADEQHAIATTLSNVDALLAKIDQFIAKKRDLKQAAMQQLLTGQTRLPGFSGEWDVKRLGDLFAFSGGHTASRDQLSSSGYCYLHYGDIHKSTKTYIDLEAEYLDIPKLTVRLSDVTPSAMLKDGDVVFVDASEDDDGTSRHVVVVNPLEKPYISGLHTIVAKAKDDLLDNSFKRFCFQTRDIKQQFQFFAVGTKVSGISKTSIAKIELRFPSKAEQTAIASILSDMDAELAALQDRRDKTRALKQGMMQALLTGRIRLAGAH